MRTEAAVIHGKGKIKVTHVELPPIGRDEILMKVMSDSICMSTYKATILGEDHKRVPPNISEVPVMAGHEFAGEIVEVGADYENDYQVGQLIAIQPAMGLENGYSSGYSYPYFGGDTHYTIIPKIAIDKGCVLNYDGTYFANAGLAEPMSCIIGGFHAQYHTKPFVYEHFMGPVKGGKMALLGCAGPMGIGAIEYAINGPYTPSLLVVVDIDQARLDRVASLITVEDAKAKGVDLRYVNTTGGDPVQLLRDITPEGKGYDDVFVYAPVKALVELGDQILGFDGCLNFFAGPTDKKFVADFNFYNVHYEATHIVGTSGGSTGDMIESLEMSARGDLNPSFMVTHIGGLDSVPETVLNYPNIPGGKKLIYPWVRMPLTAIDDFAELGKDDEFFAGLAEICGRNNNIWNEEAEKFLLEHKTASTVE